MLDKAAEDLWKPFFHFLNSADSSHLSDINNMLDFYTKAIAANKDKIVL
jgi:hypothetical protein